MSEDDSSESLRDSLSVGKKSVVIEEGALSTRALEEAKITLGAEIQKLKSLARECTKEFTETRSQLDSIERDYKIFRATVTDPAAALDGFKASVQEELKLNDARKLWHGSAEQHFRAYCLSWVILAILLVIFPMALISNSETIFGFFRSVGEAVLVDLPENASETAILIAAVSRLVLITLPVALYIWLIRIVVRFNMRSLLLMNDANQRNTMLETYLHLVEQDAGVKADRPLILEALFRRTPGHGPDTIEPPNLADVMKLGSKGSATH